MRYTVSASLIAFLFIVSINAAFADVENGCEIIKRFFEETVTRGSKDSDGVKKLSAIEINSKFIENKNSGRLFVIKGKVRNGYDSDRNNIAIIAELYVKGRKLFASEKTYAGISISDFELVNLPINTINERLSNKDLSQVVTSGGDLPFIVIFSDLPRAELLDEFTVNVSQADFHQPEIEDKTIEKN